MQNFDYITKLIKKTNIELFLFESSANKYRPQPPEGFVALRSSKRRIFVPNDGKSVQEHIDAGDYIEHPLTQSNYDSNLYFVDYTT